LVTIMVWRDSPAAPRRVARRGGIVAVGGVEELTTRAGPGGFGGGLPRVANPRDGRRTTGDVTTLLTAATWSPDAEPHTGCSSIEAIPAASVVRRAPRLSGAGGWMISRISSRLGAPAAG
jgi:hypothetical protein